MNSSDVISHQSDMTRQLKQIAELQKEIVDLNQSLRLYRNLVDLLNCVIAVRGEGDKQSNE